MEPDDVVEVCGREAVVTRVIEDALVVFVRFSDNGEEYGYARQLVKGKDNADHG